jgi:hypothetical protein
MPISVDRDEAQRFVANEAAQCVECSRIEAMVKRMREQNMSNPPVTTPTDGSSDFSYARMPSAP